MSQLQAVILTGARDSENPLLTGTEWKTKVLLPVGGKPMVVRVMENIAASRFSPRIFVSTHDLQMLKLSTEIPYETLPSGKSAVQSLLKGLSAVPGEGWVLFVSGDHPLLTPEMIEYFVDEVMRRDLTLAAAVVSKKTVDARYPESRRTYFRARGDAYSGGNMYLINKRRFMGNPAILETIDRNRKAPWKSVFVLDPWTMLQIALQQLDLHEIIRRASRIIGCEAGVVEMPFAECCMDVDKPSDLKIAEWILRNRERNERRVSSSALSGSSQRAAH